MMDSCEDEQLDQQYSSFQDFQHLNIDLCLELICPYLDVKSLGAVADSCRQMKRAAELTFAQKHRKKQFYIYETKNLCPINHEANENEIYLSEQKSSFRFLRCFGQMISKLCVRCSRSTGTFWTHLDEYVANYCANNIKELEIWGRKNNFENLQVTFSCVEKVRLIECKLDETITKLNERFPKMRSLEFAINYFTCTEVDDRQCIEAHFPHLKHLSINMPSTRAKAIGFREKNVLNALKLNPNLQSLNLCSSFGFLTKQFVRAISEICESLDTLQITGYPLQFDGRIHFKNVKYFKIEQSYSSFRSPIPLTFDVLETFEWSSVSTLKPFLFDFVHMNPSITKMRLSFSSKSLTNDEVMEMKRSFAFVKEIEQIDILVRDNLSAEVITFFLNNCQSLKKLIFKAALKHEFDNLLKSIESLQHIPWIIDEKEKNIVYCKSIEKK